MVSPVAQQLRAVLRRFSWALPLLGETAPPPSSHTVASYHDISSHSQCKDILKLCSVSMTLLNALDLASTEIDMIDSSNPVSMETSWAPPPLRLNSHQGELVDDRTSTVTDLVCVPYI